MKSRKVTLEIEAPREFVFNKFADFDVSARILHEAIRVDFKSPNTTGLGAEWEQERTQMESEPTVAMHKITAFDAPNSYVMTTDDASSFETMTFEFTEHGSSTIVSFNLDIKMKSFAAKAAGFFLGGMLKNMLLEDLTRMKLHAESDYRKSTSES